MSTSGLTALPSPKRSRANAVPGTARCRIFSLADSNRVDGPCPAITLGVTVPRRGSGRISGRLSFRRRTVRSEGAREIRPRSRRSSPPTRSPAVAVRRCGPRRRRPGDVRGRWRRPADSTSGSSARPVPSAARWRPSVTRWGPPGSGGSPTTASCSRTLSPPSSLDRPRATPAQIRANCRETRAIRRGERGVGWSRRTSTATARSGPLAGNHIANAATLDPTADTYRRAPFDRAPASHSPTHFR